MHIRSILQWVIILSLLLGCNLVNPSPSPLPAHTTTPEPISQATANKTPTPAQMTPDSSPLPVESSATPPPQSPTDLPTALPSPIPTATARPPEPEMPWSSLLADEGAYYWALIGDSTSNLDVEREAGIEAKVFSLSWRLYEESDGVWNQDYIARKQADFRQIRDAGLEVILSLGYHDPPDWIHAAYANSRYMNQREVPYVSLDPIDGGDINLVWNPQMRFLVERYVAHALSIFGSDVAAVRVGGGRFGELSYPPAEYEGLDNAYWAFDEIAQTQNPVPGWRPGEPVSGDEPARFLEWYLDALVEFQNWQIEMVRASYAGPLMILYPSWGLRPGDIALALATGLDGSSPPERNGEVQRGYDFARQIAALTDPNLILTTTWLDANIYPDLEQDGDPRYWDPARFLAHLAAEHPLQPPLFGENTGQGSEQDMALSAQRMKQYGLLGMAWYRERELFSGEYASLESYRRVIQETEITDSP